MTIVNNQISLLSASIQPTENLAAINGLIQDFNTQTGPQTPISATGATLQVSSAVHAGKVVVIDRATGIAISLPPAGGTGAVYSFYVKTSMSGGSTVFSTASLDVDLLAGGIALVNTDDGDAIPVIYAAGATDNT